MQQSEEYELPRGGHSVGIWHAAQRRTAAKTKKTEAAAVWFPWVHLGQTQVPVAAWSSWSRRGSVVWESRQARPDHACYSFPRVSSA